MLHYSINANSKKMVKPKDLPLYVEEIEETEKLKKRPETLLNASKEARLAIQSTYNNIQNGIVNNVQGSMFGLIDKGKSLGSSSYKFIVEQERTPERDGIFIAGSALLGFTLGSFAKRFRFLKRLLYTSISGGGAAYLLYPSETKDQVMTFSERAYQVGRISYILAQGAEVKDAGNEQNSSNANIENNNT